MEPGIPGNLDHVLYGYASCSFSHTNQSPISGSGGSPSTISSTFTKEFARGRYGDMGSPARSISARPASLTVCYVPTAECVRSLQHHHRRTRLSGRKTTLLPHHHIGRCSYSCSFRSGTEGGEEEYRRMTGFPHTPPGEMDERLNARSWVCDQQSYEPSKRELYTSS